jgi:hypothetical protein
VAVGTTDWQNSILQTLAQFLSLPEDPEREWSVKRPTAKAYKAAVDLISEIPASKTSAIPLPRVAPDRKGGIQLEWVKGKYAIEISISPAGSFELLKVTPRDEEEGRCSLDRARETILWFSRI